MKKFSRLLCFMVAFITVMAAFCTVSFAASVGQQLSHPESGWQRFESDTNSLFVTSGSWSYSNLSTASGGISKYVKSSATIKFKFKGTKLRYIGAINTDNSEKVTISIDGNSEIMNCKYSPLTYSVLIYEKTNLENTIHTVTITKNDSEYFHFDAIDIDETGYLVDINSPDAPTNLIAISGNKKVDLSWDSVEGAASYNVKRALTAGGPYTTIATTSAITYTDTNVANGTTYYYVVTAIVNGVESVPSNEASATPTAPEVIGNPGILEITMTNGQIKEYDLSGAELLAFLNWYDGKSDGTGKAYYTITKKNNIKPFLSRKEYIAFDKISSFEVKEYTE